MYIHKLAACWLPARSAARRWSAAMRARECLRSAESLWCCCVSCASLWCGSYFFGGGGQVYKMLVHGRKLPYFTFGSEAVRSTTQSRFSSLSSRCWPVCVRARVCFSASRAVDSCGLRGRLCALCGVLNVLACRRSYW